MIRHNIGHPIEEPPKSYLFGGCRPAWPQPLKNDTSVGLLEQDVVLSSSKYELNPIVIIYIVVYTVQLMHRSRWFSHGVTRSLWSDYTKSIQITSVVNPKQL